MIINQLQTIINSITSHIPLSSFDKYVFTSFNHFTTAFKQTELFQSTGIDFGISNFNILLPCVLLIVGYGFAQWLEIKLKKDKNFAKTFNVTFLEGKKTILLVIGAIVIAVIIMI